MGLVGFLHVYEKTGGNHLVALFFFDPNAIPRQWQGTHCRLYYAQGHTQIDQRTQDHIAGHARKAVKIEVVTRWQSSVFGSHFPSCLA